MDDSEHEESWTAAHAARGERTYDVALEAYERSIALAQQDHWPEREVEARLFAASCARQMGLGEINEAHLHAAVAVARQRGLTHLLARALGELGTQAVLKGHASVGAAWYQEALEIAQSIKDVRTAATQLGNLGLLALQRGDHDSARALLTQRLEDVLTLDAAYEAADTLITLAEVELASGHRDAAEKALLRALSLQRGKQTARAVRGMACAFVLLARIARERGQPAEAQRFAKRGLRAAEASGAAREAAHARLQLGHIANGRGERTTAKQHLSRAAEDLKQLGDALQGLVAEVALAGLDVDEGALNNARHTYAAAAEGFDRYNNPNAAIDATLLVAQLDAKMGRLAEAESALNDALKRAHDLSYDAAIARIEVNLASAHGIGGRHEACVAGCLAGARRFEALGRTGDQSLALLGAGEALVNLERLDDADTIFEEAEHLLSSMSDGRGVRAAEAWRCHVRLAQGGLERDAALLDGLCDAMEHAGDLTLAMQHRLTLAIRIEADPERAQALLTQAQEVGVWPIAVAAEAWLLACSGASPESLAQDAEAKGYRSLAIRIRAYPVRERSPSGDATA
jgi:hypothetical protein